MAESEEEHQSNLMKVKKETEKLVLTQYSKSENHGIQSHHFMGKDGKLETVRDFIFLGSKITADIDCSNEIKRSLHFGRKA